MWPSRRRFSSPFWIGNFEREFRVLARTRYTKSSSPTNRLTSSLQIVKRIRESAKLVVSLPPDLQRPARDAYGIALKMVFIVAMCSTLMAYIVRLPVSFASNHTLWSIGSHVVQIPDKSLDEPEPAGPPPQTPQHPSQADVANNHSTVTSPLETPLDSDDEDRDERTPILRTRDSRPDLKRPRRLSGYESVDGVMDLESDVIGGSARRN